MIRANTSAISRARPHDPTVPCCDVWISLFHKYPTTTTQPVQPTKLGMLPCTTAADSSRNSLHISQLVGISSLREVRDGLRPPPVTSTKPAILRAFLFFHASHPTFHPSIKTDRVLVLIRIKEAENAPLSRNLAKEEGARDSQQGSANELTALPNTASADAQEEWRS